MKLKTENIFLDTSIFEANNFTNGKEINAIFKYASEGTIKLFTNSIIISEIKSRISFKLQAVKSELRKIRTNKDKPFEILRNTDSYELTRNLLGLNTHEEKKKLFEKIDKLFDDIPFHSIPIEGVSIDQIFYKYFNNIPPFSSGVLKKNEFPDAFILASIDDWCKKNKTQMIIVSGDNDWLNYNSEHILCFDNLGVLLNKISSHRKIKLKNQRLSLIDRAFHQSKFLLEKDLKDTLENDFYFDTGDVDLIQVKVLQFNWHDYMLLELEDVSAKLKVYIDVKIAAEISYEDFQSGYFDTTDKEWHFVDTVEKTIERELCIPVRIGISYSMETDEYHAVYIDEINDDFSIDLETDELGNSNIYE